MIVCLTHVHYFHSQVILLLLALINISIGSSDPHTCGCNAPTSFSYEHVAPRKPGNCYVHNATCLALLFIIKGKNACNSHAVDKDMFNVVYKDIYYAIY